MLKLKMPEVAEKKLELGDYVTVHVPGLNGNQVNNAIPCVMQVDREAFIQRILQQRGKLIDMRNRKAA
ncbi:MAG: hypothetical protein QNK24_00185 [Desulfuromusa sp.]|nr:hypothetical protein [Desulfuromusa sp.]